MIKKNLIYFKKIKYVFYFLTYGFKTIIKDEKILPIDEPNMDNLPIIEANNGENIEDLLIIEKRIPINKKHIAITHLLLIKYTIDENKEQIYVELNIGLFE